MPELYTSTTYEPKLCLSRSQARVMPWANQEAELCTSVTYESKLCSSITHYPELRLRQLMRSSNSARPLTNLSYASGQSQARAMPSANHKPEQ
ncbi:hypothetical protein BHM03_00002878 [Ensete ventricosum]|uniref:Uncharacterized protein n=1 Tax=Ensete ventricosum TaxID=4639 RepID=A0A445M9T4_ENSVE|nr:hypothetical protein BHM03_00002878 [Ensete ventricosum]